MTLIKEIFAKHPNEYFIESGSCRGDGIQAALDGRCFKFIYSIELSVELYEHCQKRFAAFPEVILIQGDSKSVLPKILDKINGPVTFWLDGHYSGGDTARGESNSPILTELETIQRHHIKNHTIMIDDVRCFGTIWFDNVKLEQAVRVIKRINSEYQIFYEDSSHKNDILVARVPQCKMPAV